MAWERLPADTTDTCDKTAYGWSQNANEPARCGKSATFIDRQTCGCGQCDMTHRECSDHRIEGLEDQLARSATFEQRLVNALRRANLKLDSDEAARLHAAGMRQTPPPPPHPIGTSAPSGASNEDDA